MRDRKQIDRSDIESNLVEIRRYLDAHIQSAGQDNGGGNLQGPSVWETYRRAEYRDGRRPRFAPTDLILGGLVLAFIGLLAIFLLY